jgi:hypothetical protein
VSSETRVERLLFRFLRYGPTEFKDIDERDDAKLRGGTGGLLFGLNGLNGLTWLATAAPLPNGNPPAPGGDSYR